MSVERLNYFYVRENGNVPKELLGLCLDMTELFENYPAETNAKGVLDNQSHGRLRKTIERLGAIGFDMLCRTKKGVKKSDDIYLMKSGGDGNPRLYITDFFDGKYVFLHGLKKKQYDEDPADLAKAEERLEDLKERCG